MTIKDQIIRYLRGQPDGAEVKKISADLGIHPSLVQKIVRQSSRIYVDRWIKPDGKGRCSAVHMAVGPDEATPEDCPPPAKVPRVRESKRKSRSVWQAWG
jgi:hypothetical protein